MLLWGGLCLVTLLGGLTWYDFAVSEPNVQDFSGQRAVIEGKVVRDTEYSEGGAWMGFSVQRVWVGDSRNAASGKVVVYTDPVPSYSQGDVLRITAEIDPLSDISNSGYRAFLERQGYVGTVRESAEIELVQRSWLFGFRNRLAESISTALAEPQASLAEGLLLGIRSHMPDELRTDFSKTGTSHLLAISGFNLAVIGGAILGAAAWVFGRQRPVYLVVTLVMVWLYSALTGMQPPVFRSAIMFSLVLAALWMGRPYFSKLLKSSCSIPSSNPILVESVIGPLLPSISATPSFLIAFPPSSLCCKPVSYHAQTCKPVRGAGRSILPVSTAMSWLADSC